LILADEEDIFDADFESTDEEAQDEEAVGELAAQEEEKRARKARVPSTTSSDALIW
jgi:vacuolar protein sorting-associated protein 72